MGKKKVRLTNRTWKSSTGDSKTVQFKYQVLSPPSAGLGDYLSEPAERLFTVGVTGTLQALWGLDDSPLEGVLVAYVKDQITNRLYNGYLLPEEEIQLSSTNAPPEPPFDPNQIEYLLPMEFEVEIPQLVLPTEEAPRDVAGEIIDLRDNINAIFSEKFGSRLLGVPQERALFELSRSCNTREEFNFRLSSLAGLAVSIETREINTHIEAPPNSGSIDRMALFLRAILPTEDIESVIEPIANLNRLRRMFPVHADDASGVQAAHLFFGLDYPIHDFAMSWVALLNHYAAALRALLALVKKML